MGAAQTTENDFCLHQILQELILNLNFTKYELARFISSHSNHITTALQSPPKKTPVFFRQEQTEKLIRMYKHIQEFDSQARAKEFYQAYLFAEQGELAC